MSASREPTPRPASSTRRLRVAAGIVAVLACSLVGAFFSPPVRAWREERRLFQVCSQFGLLACEFYLDTLPAGAHRDEVDDRLFSSARSPREVYGYRRHLPQGRHVAEVDRRAAALYDAAIAAYRARAQPSAHPSAPDGIEALVRSLEALRDAGDITAYLRFVDAGGGDGEVPALDTREVERHLADAVDTAATFGLMSFTVEGAARVPASAPVVIEVRYVISRGPRTFARTSRAGKPTTQELIYAWSFSFRWPKRPDLAPVTVALETRPDDHMSSGFPETTTTDDMMARSAVGNLPPLLKAVFGVPVPAEK